MRDDDARRARCVAPPLGGGAPLARCVGLRGTRALRTVGRPLSTRAASKFPSGGLAVTPVVSLAPPPSCIAAGMGSVLLVAAAWLALGQPQTHIYDGETDAEMMERARATAREQGYNPDDVVEMGAPFPGEWDDAQDEKRCSGCMGSMIELHRSLSTAAAKRWNVQNGHGDGTELREIPLLEAIDEACTKGVEGYGFGQVEDAGGAKRVGFYHKRQQIVRTMDDKIGKDMGEMCYRLAEDSDRAKILATAHTIDARALAWESCVLLNRDEPKSVYFGGQMCSEQEAVHWLSVLLPEQTEQTRADQATRATAEEVQFTFDEYMNRYGYRLQQSEARGGKSAEQIWKEADADGNGLLSRAEIAVPAVRDVLAPKTVDEHLFAKKFGKLQFKGGESTAQVFALLDKNGDGLLDLHEMRDMKRYILTDSMPREL
jgi:hypothetical protein